MIPKANQNLIGEYADLKDLRRKVDEWLKLNFIGKTIINEQTKFEIGFNSKSFEKLVSGKAGAIKLLCLTAIEDIVKQGILKDVLVDKKQRKDVIAFYNFQSNVLYDGITYRFWFTVKHLPNGKFLYSGNLNVKNHSETIAHDII